MFTSFFLSGLILSIIIIFRIVRLQFRLVLAYASAMGTDLNWKERLYVTISSFPKATVQVLFPPSLFRRRINEIIQINFNFFFCFFFLLQAALAPVALDLVRNNNLNENYEELAVKVLIVSVLAIVITAPLGAILMVKLASKFLQKSQLQPSPWTCLARQSFVLKLRRGKNSIYMKVWYEKKKEQNKSAA